MYKVRSKIAGVTHKNDDGTLRQDLIKKFVWDGKRLVLEPDPNNKFSKNATKIMVETPNGLQQIGFVKAGDTPPPLDEQVADALREMRKVTCYVLNVTGGSAGKETLGVNVEFRIYESTTKKPATQNTVSEDSPNPIFSFFTNLFKK